MILLKNYIDIIENLEIRCMAFQGVVEIVYGNVGINFFLPFCLQFCAFCLSIVRYFLIFVDLYVVPYVNEFGFVVPLILWFWFWYTYIRTLQYIKWFQFKKLQILNSNFIKNVWPSWSLWLNQYISYFSTYNNIVKTSINLSYKSLGKIRETIFGERLKINWDKIINLSTIINFICTFLLYVTTTFKFGNRKQTYFRNYFNAKRRFNNWIWKWRK